MAAAIAGGCGSDDGVEVKATGDIPTTGSFLFVVEGDAQAEDGRLSIETDTVKWFTDRPQRRAGVSEVAELADRWSAFGLVNDPPNAAVAGGSTQTVVELSDPKLGDGSITFAYKPLRGQSLDEGELGEVSAFLDATSEEAGAPLSCEKETVEGAQGCKFLLRESTSFTVESMAQTACSAYDLGSGCDEFMSSDTPILVLALGGNGGNGDGWGAYSAGKGGAAGYAQSVQVYGEVSGQTWYAYVGGSGSHKSDGGTGGMASLVLKRPLSELGSGDEGDAVIVIAGGGGGGGPANSDGAGYRGGDGGHTWAAGTGSWGPNAFGEINAFGPGASIGGEVATSFGGSPGPKGCGWEYFNYALLSEPDYACGGSISVVANGEHFNYVADSGKGGEQTGPNTHQNELSGDYYVAPVGGNAPDKKMSYDDFVGGTAIDPGIATTGLSSGGAGFDGGAGGGGGWGGGGGSGPHYTCGHGDTGLMYCGGAGGGSFADFSSLGRDEAPVDWYESLYGGGSSAIEVWVVEQQ